MFVDNDESHQEHSATKQGSKILGTSPIHIHPRLLAGTYFGKGWYNDFSRLYF